MAKTGYFVFEWTFHISVMVVFASAIFLNSIILYILRRKQLKTTTFVLIANQITAEILFSVSVISRNWFCWSRVVNSSTTSSMVCGLVSSVSDAAIYVTAFSMLMIAYERYRKLYRPFVADINSKLWMAFIWLFSALLSIVNNVNKPNPMFFNEKSLYGCKVSFRSNLCFFTKGYNFLLIFIFCDIIPLLATAFLYFKVIRKIRERKLIGNTVTTDKNDKLAENKRKTTEMLISIVVWYFIITIPFYIFSIIQIFVNKSGLPMACTQEERPPIELFFIGGIYYLGSLCVNPFIILYYNPDFRQEFYLIFHCKSNHDTK